MGAVYGFLKKYRGLIGLTFVFALCSALQAVILPIEIGKAIDNVTVRQLIFMSILIIVSGICSWLSINCNANISQNISCDIRTALFSRIQKAPIPYIDKTGEGELLSRVISDCKSIEDGLLQGSLQLFTAFITVIGTLIAMGFLSPILTGVVIVMTPLPFLSAKLIAKSVGKATEDMAEARAQMTSFANERIKNLKLIKTLTARQETCDTFQAHNMKFSKIAMKSTFVASLTNPVTRFVNWLLYIVILIIGMNMIIKGYGGFTIGHLVTFLIFANQYGKPFNEISNTYSELTKAYICAKRVFGIINKDFPKQDGDITEISKLNITFKNITFGYNPEKPIIKNFSFECREGDKVAVVGKTGCGKTTLVNLLMGFYQPQNGEILIGGTNINEISRETLHNIIGMVLQDTWIFSGSIAENIGYGKPESTFDEIINAAKKAQVHKIIMNMGGYDIVIGEDDLSDGERQLICIARVMLRSPQMLILDEATSAIDLETEKKIANAFDELTKDKTSIVIAHRQETLKNSDKIVTLGK